eukprot:368612-Rhodomonas_salina.6
MILSGDRWVDTSASSIAHGILVRVGQRGRQDWQDRSWHRTTFGRSQVPAMSLSWPGGGKGGESGRESYLPGSISQYQTAPRG